MLSPKPLTVISSSRPTKYMRAFLSSSFWVPIATLSYSMYIWHLIIAVVFKVIIFKAWIPKFDSLTMD
jgi:peptidoglycan/LPS O-acetylase OafA/YrhL